MLKKVLIGLVAIIAALFIYAGFQPADYLISREIMVNAPVTTVFPFINNSRLMEEWAPWPDLDPELKMTYTGPEAGAGAKSSWDSKGQMGAGSATVVESIPNQVVRTKLEFTRPFEMQQEAEISVEQVGEQTKVKWSVKGKNNLIGRFFCIFMNMDKMVGRDFENGLNKLKVRLDSK